MSDPVCHIPTPTTSAQKQQPQPVKMPVIPPAVDLQSALVAINQMRLVLQQITGQLPGVKPALNINPNITLQNNQGLNPLDPLGNTLGTPKLGRYLEDKKLRVVNTVKVSGATIERVDQVVFVDSITGEALVWKR